jgi:hypothetical protein
LPSRRGSTPISLSVTGVTIGNTVQTIQRACTRGEKDQRRRMRVEPRIRLLEEAQKVARPEGRNHRDDEDEEQPSAETASGVFAARLQSSSSE